tara:strand:+ start:81 stop:287 length:207 start_codon:yes stop_codon:yes gene_type:complete
MQIIKDSPAMELTSEQVWGLLKEELLNGLYGGQITEEEFLDQLKTLRAVVDNSTFSLIAIPSVTTDNN